MRSSILGKGKLKVKIILKITSRDGREDFFPETNTFIWRKSGQKGNIITLGFKDPDGPQNFYVALFS